MPSNGSEALDPVCMLHGRKMSEHRCLYCCLCFRELTIGECVLRPNGKREDVCEECADTEAAIRLLEGI